MENWIYCGINIPVDVDRVPSIDRVNTHYKNGSATKKGSTMSPYTIKEYQAKYAITGADGKLYWKR